MSAAKHICDICGTSFSERWMLNRHLVIHNGANFQCQLCSKSFNTQGYLRKHEKTHDNKDVKFQCGQCEANFISKSGYTKHITTKHIDFMYGCLYCDKSFSRKEYYEIHVERCSSKTKENLKIDCDQCEKTFDTKRLLARHKRNNHVTEKFTCETCHGTFWSQHTLGNHIRQVHVKKVERYCRFCKKMKRWLNSVKTFENVPREIIDKKDDRT